MSAQAISPSGHVGDAQRGRQHRVVGLRIAQLEEDVERGVVDRPVHRRRGQQPRRHEDRVRDRLAAGQDDVADEPADARSRSRAGRRPARRSPTRGRSRSAGRPSRCARPGGWRTGPGQERRRDPELGGHGLLHQGPAERHEAGRDPDDDVGDEHDDVDELVAPVGLVAEDQVAGEGHAVVKRQDLRERAGAAPAAGRSGRTSR